MCGIVGFYDVKQFDVENAPAVIRKWMPRKSSNSSPILTNPSKILPAFQPFTSVNWQEAR